MTLYTACVALLCRSHLVVHLVVKTLTCKLKIGWDGVFQEGYKEWAVDAGRDGMYGAGNGRWQGSNG